MVQPTSLQARILRRFGWEMRSSLARNGRRYIKDMVASAREAEVKPFLMWGTLLGYVREGGFLPHDGDIDLGIRPDDYARRDAFIKAMQRRHYRLDYDKPYQFRLSHPHHALSIDIDLFYPWQDRIICAATRNGSIVAEHFAPGSFDRLRKVDFLDGLEVFIPDPPEPILAAVYGDWRQPRPDYDSSVGPLNRLDIAPGDPVPPLRPEAAAHATSRPASIL